MAKRDTESTEGMARRVMEQAKALAWEKASQMMAGAPGNFEEMLDRKKEQYLEEALARLQVAMRDLIDEVEERVDRKVEDVERRLEENVLREFRVKMKIMFLTSGAFAAFGVILLGYIALK